MWDCRRAEIEIETPLKMQAYVQRDSAITESYTEIYPDRQGSNMKPYRKVFRWTTQRWEGIWVYNQTEKYRNGELLITNSTAQNHVDKNTPMNIFHEF